MRIQINLLYSVQRTYNATGSTVQNMGINHGGAYITVAKKFLDCADIIAGFKKMCCK